MGEDFSAADPLEIVFGVNDTMACAMVSIIDDNALEGDHSFSVQIVSTVPPITIDNTPVEVTIMDNEGTNLYKESSKQILVHCTICDAFVSDRCYREYCVL